MDEKTRKKVLALEYGIAITTLIAIVLTTYKASITYKAASNKI
jgi:hypothetical protein